MLEAASGASEFRVLEFISNVRTFSFALARDELPTSSRHRSGLNCSTANFFNIAALANPFRAQRRKSLCHIAVKIRIAPWAARVVHAHRLIDFDFTVHGLSRCERDFPERNANVGMKFPDDVNLPRIRKLQMLAHDRIESQISRIIAISHFPESFCAF